jgi:hypothetical protein
LEQRNLPLVPCGIIGTTRDFSVPTTFEFRSNAKPSLFDYQAPIEKVEEEKGKKVDTV